MGSPSPEPPIAEWQEELKNRPKGSEESMAEVMRESEARKKSGNKRKKAQGSLLSYFRRKGSK